MLFADIKGSTELIESLDPENSGSLTPALHVHDGGRAPLRGHVNQVLGDGIMALFGAPLPMRTMRCGPVTPPWPCRRPCARYGAEVRHAYGLEVQIRVGLNSGEVVVRY